MKTVHEVWKDAQKRNLNDAEFKKLLVKEGIIIQKQIKMKKEDLRKETSDVATNYSLGGGVNESQKCDQAIPIMKNQVKKIVLELIINDKGEEVNSLDVIGITGNEALALMSWATFEINSKMHLNQSK